MTKPITVCVQILDHASDLPLPHYQTQGAAGMDLYAAIADTVIVQPMQRLLIPTGLKLALPKATEAQIRPRSGLALNHGLTVLNAPGTIDCDYRGEVKILLINLGQDDVEINHGMRIAQLVIASVLQASLIPVIDLDTTERGAHGFGSTGTSI